MVVDPEGARLAAEGSRRPKARADFLPWLDAALPTLPQAAPPPPEPDPEAVFWDKTFREMEEEARTLVAAKEREEAEPLPAGGRAVVPFEFEGAAVRVVMRDGEPWFVLADVCRVLEIGNPSQAASRLDDDEKCALALGEGGSVDGLTETETSADPRVHTLILVSAPGLYGLITTSHKPSARKFKRWVNHEVLPSIQRTGGYMMNVPGETEKQFWARAVLMAQETLARKDEVIAQKDGVIVRERKGRLHERAGRLHAEARLNLDSPR